MCLIESALVFFFFFFFQSLASRLGRLEPTGHPPPFLLLLLIVRAFLVRKNKETYKKLNILRSVWVERKVVLDELDPEIRRNFEHKG